MNDITKMDPPSNESSNYYKVETSPGSGRFNLCVRDKTQFYRGMAHGYFLDFPDELIPKLMDYLIADLIDSIQPHLTYTNFELGERGKPQEAMSEASWAALSESKQALLEECVLTKVGEAHIQLQLLN